MIDIHTHILPGIDDGPKQVQEALKMSDIMQKEGIHTAVCTPHFDPAGLSMEEFIQMRSAALAQMKEARIRLIPASETLLHEYLFHYTDLEALCIENTRYLLLELPYSAKRKDWILCSIEKLKNYYSIIPIIAHIERYPWLKDRDITLIRSLGCRVQLNAQSVLEPRKRSKAMNYLKKGYIDVIGSDCHNLGLRPPCLQEALEFIRSKLGNEYYGTLDTNSRYIVKGVVI